AFDRRGRADFDDAIADDGDGIGLGMRWITGPYSGVADDEIGAERRRPRTRGAACQSHHEKPACGHQAADYSGRMPHSNPSDQELKQLLTDATTIAMVGASSNPDKASHGIMKKLQRAGYRVVPVNPKEPEVLGERSYASLLDVPERIDIVDVFRRAEDTPPIADEAVTIGAKARWLQTGIASEEAAARAKQGGLTVVMDACIGATHSLLRVPAKTLA